MKQTQITKRPATRPGDIDTRTPQGKVLPWLV